MRCDFSGAGVVSLLDASKLTQTSPKLYAAFLMWLLSELFEDLPEVGDPERPKLVLFFDEAHLLFKKTPKSLVEKLEQVVRLIRSKGVGVYFVTQNPTDIPEAVLGQLGLKVQHAMRAFTQKDQRAIRATAAGLRNDDGLAIAAALTNLGLGEALVSALDERGAPTSVIEALIPPPESRIGTLAKKDCKLLRDRSPMAGKYETAVDRESAYELLQQRAEKAAEQALEEARLAEAEQRRKAEEKQRAAEQRKRSPRRRTGGRRRQTASEAFFKSAVRSVGRSLGTRLVRGLLGSLLK